MKKYILFDLDGTLTDSGEGIKNAIRYALNQMNVLDYKEDILNSFIGPPLSDSFKTHFNFSDMDTQRAIDTYRVYYSDKGKFENRPYDAIEELLEKLKKNGHDILLATSKPEVFAIEILKHFNLYNYFDYIAGASLDGSLIYKDDIIKHCLDNYTIDIENSFMVGDRFYDIESGLKWGLKTIGVTYGFGSREELINAKANFIVDRPMEIYDIVEEN